MAIWRITQMREGDDHLSHMVPPSTKTPQYTTPWTFTACIKPSHIFTMSFKCINFLPRSWSTSHKTWRLNRYIIEFFFFMLLLYEHCLKDSPCMFFPLHHHKIPFQNVNSICVFFTLILLNIQNRNQSHNSSPNLLLHYKTDSFSGFVIEMSQYFVYQHYDKIQNRA